MENNPALVWLSSLDNKKSIKRYTHVINRLCKLLGCCNLHDFDWVNFTYIDLLQLRQILISNGLKPSSINVYISVMKSICREAWQLNIISYDQYQKIQHTKRIRCDYESSGRALSIDELRKIIRWDECKKKDIRDSAVIALSYAVGMRIAEIADAVFGDIDLVEQVIFIRGKNNKTSTLSIPDFAIPILQKWINTRGNWQGSLFCHVIKGDYIVRKRLSERAIDDLVRKRRLDADLSKFSHHDLRRSFGTHLLNSGVDLLLVQKLMRHSSVNTTRIYDKRDKNALSEAIKLLPF